MEYTEVPKKIKLAANLVYASLLVGILNLLFSEVFTDENILSEPGGLVFLAAITTILGFLGYKIGQGKNWARIIFLIMVLFGTIGYPDFISEEFKRNIVLGVVSIIQLVLQFYALVLLFNKESVQWYKRPPEKSL